MEINIMPVRRQAEGLYAIQVIKGIVEKKFFYTFNNGRASLYVGAKAPEEILQEIKKKIKKEDFSDHLRREEFVI